MNLKGTVDLFTLHKEFFTIILFLVPFFII